MRLKYQIPSTLFDLANGRRLFPHSIFFILLFSIPFSIHAQNKVESFRYEIPISNGDYIYTNKISNSISNGLRYEVETDVSGRILRVTEFRDGKKTLETLYTFSGSDMFPSGYKTYRSGELSGIVEIQRNARGDRSRRDNYTSLKVPTGYALYIYNQDYTEVTNYSAEAKRRSIYHYYYSGKGQRNRSVFYPEPDNMNVYYDSEIDENIGLEKTRKKIENSVLSVFIKYSYDANGDLTRQDLYDSKDNWYGMFEYSQGLLQKKMYKLNDTIQEIRISYDVKRLASESKLYFNNNLICIFTYDRLPDGTVKRSLASGPTGELWAEYPDLFVNEVKRNGQALDKTGAIIYKQGNWW